jgi:hypothetical protein
MRKGLADWGRGVIRDFGGGVSGLRVGFSELMVQALYWKPVDGSLRGKSENLAAAINTLRKVKEREQNPGE